MKGVLEQFFELSEAVFTAVREGKAPSDEAVESLLAVLDGLATE